ncbi:hypothetical protein Tco_1048243, partial [Tanacetum coccineum]
MSLLRERKEVAIHCIWCGRQRWRGSVDGVATMAWKCRACGNDVLSQVTKAEGNDGVEVSCVWQRCFIP